MIKKKGNIKITCIPTNMERFLSFSIGNLRFIDSLQFMGESLEKLTTNLARGGLGKFVHTHANTPDVNQLRLLVRKGVFPYGYWDSPSKADDTVLPAKEHFYNSLACEDVSDADYEHAKLVW
jgi:hypothetical protein